MNEAAPKIFNFDFPIWMEQYRPILEKKILMHYFNREIGLETVALWKFYLETRLSEIMPYYNQLYQTTVKDYDWFGDTDITETLEREENKTETAKFKSTEDNDTDTTDDTTTSSNSKSNTDASNTGSGTSHTMHNDFPQTPLEEKDYATYEDYTQDTETKSGTQTGSEEMTGENNRIVTTNQDISRSSDNNVTGNTDTSHTITRKGSSGSRSFNQMLLEYRDTLINIDMLIIKDLGDLFMTIY